MQTKYILSYQTEAIYQTVVDGRQVVEIIENGQSIFVDETLMQFITNNEIYYGTNAKAAKRIVEDVIGIVHAVPYIFMGMVWIPLVVKNRSDSIFIALHHFKRIHDVSVDETVIELTSGVRIRLPMNRSSVLKRIRIASVVKILVDLRKNSLHQPKNLINSQCEIVKEKGNVYFTRKR